VGLGINVAIANAGERLQATDAYLSTNIARRYFTLTASPAPSRLKKFLIIALPCLRRSASEEKMARVDWTETPS
jgi:hypothetical protein